MSTDACFAPKVGQPNWHVKSARVHIIMGHCEKRRPTSTPTSGCCGNCAKTVDDNFVDGDELENISARHSSLWTDGARAQRQIIIIITTLPVRVRVRSGCDFRLSHCRGATSATAHTRTKLQWRSSITCARGKPIIIMLPLQAQRAVLDYGVGLKTRVLRPTKKCSCAVCQKLL